MFAFKKTYACLEFPASGGAQVSCHNVGKVKTVHAVNLSKLLVKLDSSRCNRLNVTIRDDIGVRLRDALLAQQDNLQAKVNDVLNSQGAGFLSYEFKDPVEFLGHARVVKVDVYYA